MGDKPTDFQRLRALCQQARGLSPDDLSRFLERECGGNPALADEVRRLLQLDAGGDDVLEGQAHEAMGLADDAADVTVTRVDGASPDTTWEEFLAQIRGRGENWFRYEDQGEVARGGMGAIHRVFDQDLRRTLAMKVILNRDGDPAETDASLGRFLEEAQVTSQLDHPGIVPIHELGVDREAQVYFTMKLVKGEDLRSVFERVSDPNDAEWTETRALNIMLRVCEAMAYAHAKGVIHRDLKPGNVMVGKYGETYVMDWGLAKVLGREDKRDLRVQPDATSSLKTARDDVAGETPDSPILTMDGAVVGTPAYMPPEQALGKGDELGPPADVYAVGAMLYHLVSGRMPYTQPSGQMSPRTILALVTHGPPTPLTDLAPAATAELIAIIEKAMAREIAGRYPDMTALARDLRSFLENRVVAAYETGAWAELKKWVQRNKTLAMTAAAAVMVVAALGTWSNLTIRAERDLAEAERDRVFRLSDVKDLDNLVARVDALWPAHPKKIGALEAWLRDADELLGHVEAHESTLDELRSRGAPEEHEGAPEIASLRTERDELAAKRDAATEEKERAALAEQLDALDARIEALATTIEREQPYNFAGETRDGWWHDTLVGLVSGLHALDSGDVHGQTRASVVRRLEDARTILKRSIEDHRLAWNEAIAAIGSSPKYGGLKIREQLGLVPIGADRESGLWEFWHVPTGDRPSRDEETGALKLTEETGLVFVLIPGGTYRIGAQKDDEAADHFDSRAVTDESPVHEVTLSPYFLSKYEMTQGQWAWFTGTNPSSNRPKSDHVKTLQHPVEQVNWDMCVETLFRLGLMLPTEAQWEAACRAGTETPWSTGREKESLEGFANLADQAAKRAGATWPAIEDWPELDDGFPVHAPVGSYRANAFGLDDMHGNVFEWCRDGYAGYDDVTPIEGDGLRDVPGASRRVYRGGSFSLRASLARSAFRDGNNPGVRGSSLGLRPARFCN